MNLTSERGIIQPPNLDDRTWQDLVDEMKSLIPKYAPQWTDHGPSDLGITLIELFAWLVEQLIYRLNQVPEKNYIAFLKLLGIPRDPPAPAHTYLTFTPTGPKPVVLKRDDLIRAQTAGNEREAPVVFEIDADLTVLPIKLAHILLFDGTQLTSISDRFAMPPGKGYTLSVAANGTAQICLGFDKPTDQPLRLLMKYSKPLSEEDSKATTITWCYSANDPQGGQPLGPTKWLAISEGTNASPEQKLQRNGVVELMVPAATWTSQDAAKDWPNAPAGTHQSGHWVGIRIENTSAVDLGICFILFNSVSAHNALTVKGEELKPDGDDSDYQIRSLLHRPLFRQPDSADPYDDLKVEVDGKEWTRVPDLLVDLDPNNPDEVYIIDPVVGEIRFGGVDSRPDPVTGQKLSRGARPDGKITASYRYVAGGASGNVGAGTVIIASSSEVTVTNPFAAVGGFDEEPIEEAKRRAPGLLKTRSRAITKEDYEYLTRELFPEVRIVRCLEPGNTTTPFDRSPGKVNLIIVPDADLERPKPAEELILRVKSELDRRRDVTANLVVNGPEYLPITVTADFVVWERAITSGVKLQQVMDDANRKIKDFLHPTRGGPNRSGWQVGHSVFVSDLFKAIAPPADIGYISKLEMTADGTSHPPVVIPKDYQLVCSADVHAVTAAEEK